MAKRVRTDQIPSTPDELYVQLYCERKGAHDEDTIQKARHSWMSLSNSKKKLFYKTIEKKHCMNYAHGLSKSKIYLKEKTSKRHLVHNYDKAELDQNIATPSSNDQSDDTPQSVENSLRNENEENITNFETRSEEEPQQETQSHISNIQQAAEMLVEPVPPTVQTGKEFYEVLKSPEDPLWSKMSQSERRHYFQAVQTIKRDYIKKYMKYLESLPQQQLFDHYMKTLHYLKGFLVISFLFLHHRCSKFKIYLGLTTIYYLT